MEKILFVCTGNTCRSSMAESIFRSAVEADVELSGKYTIASAGISALNGDPASFNAVKALKDNWALDISSHRAKRLEKEDVESADLILAMTRNHKQAIISLFPGAGSRVFTLKEYAMDSRMEKDIDDYDYTLDILDPFGMSEQVYKKCANEIKAAVDKVIVRLKSSSK